MAEASRVDHRTRTAASRRERMRTRLLDSALVVIATRGIARTTAEELIRLAGVSRGSFYNYFGSIEELVGAVGYELKTALFVEVREQVMSHPGPAERLAAALAILLVCAERFPMLARLVRALAPQSGNDRGINERLVTVLRNGVNAGQFLDLPPEVMIDIVTGTSYKLITRVLDGSSTQVHRQHAIAGILRALGVPDADASRMAAVRVQPIELRNDGLLDRALKLSLNHSNPIPQLEEIES